MLGFTDFIISGFIRQLLAKTEPCLAHTVREERQELSAEVIDLITLCRSTDISHLLLGISPDRSVDKCTLVLQKRLRPWRALLTACVVKCARLEPLALLYAECRDSLLLNLLVRQ